MTPPDNSGLPPGYSGPPGGYQGPPAGYQGPPGGYQGPPGGYPGYPPPQQRSKTPLIIGSILAVLLIAGLAAFLLFPSDASAGEVFLVPAASAGPDPFSDTSFSAPPDPTLAKPAAESGAPIPAAPSGTQITARSGSTPGLYGGTRDKASCNAQQLVAFLGSNPDKAGAWVSAITADPDAVLPDGRPITQATIGEYVATLTPIVLLEDTRVTNHGYKNGRPTRLQSVLQKGTAVLADDKGVPRVKCACGNPLLPPVASRRTPVYRGPVWPDFDPAKINVIQQSPRPIETFVLLDRQTGQMMSVPRGWTGGPLPPNTGQLAQVPPALQGQVTPTPNPNQAPPPSPTPSAPSTNNLCSPNGTTSPTTVQFVNRLSVPVEIVWYDANCSPTSYYTLQPGESRDQPTFVGHEWAAIDPSGTSRSVFSAGASSSYWSIQ